MRTVQHTASSLPPLVGSRTVENLPDVPADSRIISVGPELNADAVPGFIRNNPDFIAHLTSVTNLQKQKLEQLQYRDLYSQAANSQVIDSQVAKSQSSFENHADFFAESQFRIEKEAEAIEDASLQNVLSMDFRTEPSSSEALLSESVTSPSAILSKEEQLELATKFLAKIEELLKQTI